MTCTCSNGWVVTDQSGYDGTRTQVTRPCEQCRPGLRRALMQARDWVSGGNDLIARLYRRVDAKDERIVELEALLRRCERAMEGTALGIDIEAAMAGAVVESISPERDERRPATIRMRQGDRR